MSCNLIVLTVHVLTIVLSCIQCLFVASAMIERYRNRHLIIMTYTAVIEKS